MARTTTSRATKAGTAKTTAKASPRRRTTKTPVPVKTSTRRKQLGRSTLLTPETTAALVQVLQAGGYLTTACDYIGIGQSTVFAWLKRGREIKTRIEAMASEDVVETPTEEERPFLDFLEAITRAEASGEIKAAAMLSKGIEADMPLKVRVKVGEDYVDEVRMVPDWNNRIRASLGLVERRYRARWARGEFVETTIHADVTAKIEVTVEEQRGRMEAILMLADETGAFVAATAALEDGKEVED